GQAVTEIVLTWVPAKVLKREHSQHHVSRTRRRATSAHSAPAEIDHHSKCYCKTGDENCDEKSRAGTQPLVNRAGRYYRRGGPRQILSLRQVPVPRNYWADETIAAAGQSLNKPGIVGLVSQCNSNLFNRGIDGVVEVDKGVFGPDPLAQLLPSDQLA